VNIRRRKHAEDTLHRQAEQELDEIERARRLTEEQRRRLLYLENLMRATILRGDDFGDQSP
jgi:hypothetical protein